MHVAVNAKRGPCTADQAYILGYVFLSGHLRLRLSQIYAGIFPRTRPPWRTQCNGWACGGSAAPSERVIVNSKVDLSFSVLKLVGSEDRPNFISSNSYRQALLSHGPCLHSWPESGHVLTLRSNDSCWSPFQQMTHLSLRRSREHSFH